jgi:hypothetical protein
MLTQSWIPAFAGMTASRGCGGLHRRQAFSWWDWEHDRLGQAVADMREYSVEAFLAKYETG